MRLLISAANHAAIAIDNARLHKETLQRLAELSLLQMAGVQLTAAIEMDALLEIVVSSAVMLLNADTGSAILFNKNSQSEAVRLAITPDQPLRCSEVSLRLDGITHKVIKEGVIMTVPDTSKIDNPSDYVLQQKWGAFIGTPLRIEKRALGVLYIGYISPRQFSRHEITLLETFVNQAILAIEHAILYQETQENLKRISALYEIAQTARYIRDSNRVLKFITVAIQRYFSTVSVSFFALSDNDFFSPLYLSSIPSEKIAAYQKQPWQITEPFLKAIEEGESIQIAHLQETQYDSFRSRLLYDNAASWYAIPLVAEGHIFGMMILASQTPDLVSKDELQFLYTIAGHVAVSLENIRLIKELETQTTALREANLHLEEANKVKNRFLTTVSHELRTPMNSIIGYSEMLQDKLDGPLTPGQADSVERILRNGRNLLALINAVLDFSKIETDKSVFENGDALLEEIKHFVGCIRSGNTPDVSGEAGRRALATAIEITKLLQ